MLHRSVATIIVAFLTASTTIPSVSGDDVDCTTSSGDQMYGIFAYYDPVGCDTLDKTGCHKDHQCRFCSTFPSSKNGHMVPCPPEFWGCTTTEAEQDDGKYAYYDPSCEDPGTSPNGGTGCYDDVCRHCKAFITDKSDHLLDCPFDISSEDDEPSNSPSPSPSESPSPGPTGSPVDAPSGEDNPCETVQADKDNGVFGIEDETCKNRGKGCHTVHDGGEVFFCRHCQAFPTPKSDHLFECAGFNDGPSDPVVCDTSDGDKAKGKYAFYDPNCVNGGLGCLPGGYCRLCKEFITETSAPYVDCPE